MSSMNAPRRIRRRLPIATLGLVALAIALAGGAYATHRFTDVPTSAFYHADVSWLADTGITTGCAAGKYCPNDAVTRGQMAAFLHRMASRTRTEHFSCTGTGFIPAAGLGGYGTAGSLRWLFDGDADCPLLLPDGAVMTRFSFAYFDLEADGTVTGGIYRSDRHSSSAALAQVPPSVESFDPQVATDTTIDFPMVDNTLYDYWFNADFQGGNASVGVYGALVEYTVVGAPRP